MRNLKDHMNQSLTFNTPQSYRMVGMKFFWRALVGVILIIITLNFTALTTREMVIKNSIFSKSRSTLWYRSNNSNETSKNNKPYHTDRLPLCFQKRSLISLVEEGDWEPIPGMTQTQYRARAELDRFIRRTNDWAPVLQRKDLRYNIFVIHPTLLFIV